jgi:hypothetical protein
LNYTINTLTVTVNSNKLRDYWEFEKEDIVVTFNLSTNNSFEWRDLNSDGFYEASDGANLGDTVVDMCSRGLFPTWQHTNYYHKTKKT